MSKLILIVIVFVFGFVLGTGVGFKVLEGVSQDIVINAFESSYSQFEENYSGSLIQNKIEEVKNNMIQELKLGFEGYVKSKVNGLFN